MLEPGSTLAGYRIEGVLGKGGMGVVYEARQLSLDRPVALKVLSPDLGTDDGFKERFRREGLIQARIDHPHIVPVYEAGDGPDGLFLAMRIVRGPTLKDLIIGRELEGARTLRILGPVADALDAAHEAGLIHRDIKPQNVLVGARDHAFLADFGLTKGTSDSGLTRTGQFVGTLDYISPEQIRGEPATALSDVYSFGAVLLECLTGVVPYPKESDAAVLFAHLMEPVPLVTEQRPDLPPGLNEVIARAMAKEPEARQASATELIEQAERAFGRRIRAVITPPSPFEAPEEAGIRRAEDQVPTLETRIRDAAALSQETPPPATVDPTQVAPAAAAAPPLAEPTQIAPAAEPTEVAPAVPPTEVAPAIAPVEPTQVAPAAAAPPLSAGTSAAGPVTAPTEVAPVAATERAQPAPKLRTGALIAVLAVVAGAAAVGFLTGHSGKKAATVKAGNSAATADLQLRFPAAWEQTPTVPRIPGLSLHGPIALKTRDGSALVAGRVDGEGATLLPKDFLSRLPGAPARDDRVKLGALQAYRYRGLKPRGLAQPLTLFVAQTSAGIEAIGCYGAQLAGCEDIAAGAKLLRGSALPLPPNPAYASAIGKAIDKLNSDRAKGRTRLRVAKTPRAQASAARQLSLAYGTASLAVGKAPTDPASAGVQRDLLSGLAAGRRGYRNLAAAARAGDSTAYARARTAIAAADRSVRAAIKELATLGYRVG